MAIEAVTTSANFVRSIGYVEIERQMIEKINYLITSHGNARVAVIKPITPSSCKGYGNSFVKRMGEAKVGTIVTLGSCITFINGTGVRLAPLGGYYYPATCLDVLD